MIAIECSSFDNQNSPQHECLRMDIFFFIKDLENRRRNAAARAKSAPKTGCPATGCVGVAEWLRRCRPQLHRSGGGQAGDHQL